MSETSDAFTHATLPSLDKRVLRLGVAGSFGIQEQDVHHAVERGVNYWVWTPSFKKVTSALRQVLHNDREQHIVSLLGIAYTGGMVRRGVDKARRILGTDYLDCYKLGWLGRGSLLSGGIQDTLLDLKDRGVVRSLGTSIHDRVRAGKLARESILDTFMIRYNAKHPGAEKDIFPHLSHRNPAIVAYTATSWRQLLKPVSIEMPPYPGDRPGVQPPPLTAALCYRFCLSHANVHVTLTGPADRKQLDDNLDALDAGPLSANEDVWIREYGRKLKSKQLF